MTNSNEIIDNLSFKLSPTISYKSLDFYGILVFEVFPDLQQELYEDIETEINMLNS
jgi:hypothetical protein